MKGEMKNLRVIVWWGAALVKHRREDQDRRVAVTLNSVHGAILVNATIAPWAPR